MKIMILGSGGTFSIPRACCGCAVCSEARQKGVPYARGGPSIFLEDLKLVIDTPDDLNQLVNREWIMQIDGIMFTHWHGDHTYGLRIIERIGRDIVNSRYYPTNVYITDDLYDDLSEMDMCFKFYENLGLVNSVRLMDGEAFRLGNIDITPVKLKPARFGEINFYEQSIYAYIFEESGKRVLFCPDHMTQLPIEDIEPGFDASFFECGYFENFGNGELLPKDHWLRWRLLPFDRQLELIDELKSKMTIICHLEDVWGRNYDDYLRLEQQNRSKNITFAIDGMIVEI